MCSVISQIIYYDIILFFIINSFNIYYNNFFEISFQKKLKSHNIYISFNAYYRVIIAFYTDTDIAMAVAVAEEAEFTEVASKCRKCNDHTIGIHDPDSRKFRDVIMEYHFQIFCDVITRIYFNEKKKSEKQTETYRIWIPYHDTYTGIIHHRETTLKELKRTRFYDILFKRYIVRDCSVVSSFTTILQYLYGRSIKVHEFLDKHSHSCKVLEMHEPVVRNAEILTEFEKVVIAEVEKFISKPVKAKKAVSTDDTDADTVHVSFSSEGKGEEVDVVKEVVKSSIFQEYGVVIDFSKYGDKKDEIDEFINKTLHKFVSQQDTELSVKIISLKASFENEQLRIDTTIKKLQEEIQTLQRLKLRTNEKHTESLVTTKGKHRTMIKFDLEQQTRKFLEEIYYESCMVCTDKLSDDKFLLLDCKHRICKTCYILSYNLPKAGGMLKSGIILKCLVPDCHQEIPSSKVRHVIPTKEARDFYAEEAVKYESIPLQELRSFYICYCWQCKTSYTVKRACGDIVTQTRCDKCISKDPTIKLVFCANEDCRAYLERRDGCNALHACYCGTHTCYVCGERLGGIAGHDETHFAETAKYKRQDRYFHDECCQGRGKTLLTPTKVTKDGKLLKEGETMIKDGTVIGELRPYIEAVIKEGNEIKEAKKPKIGGGGDGGGGGGGGGGDGRLRYDGNDSDGDY